MPNATLIQDGVTTPVIRPAVPADIAPVLHMIGDLARHHGDAPRASSAGLERDVFGPAPWISALVAEQRGSLLGYAILCRVYRAQFGERGIDLHHLFVVPQARGAGLGRRLVEAALDAARTCGCTYCVVGAHPENATAHRFYERLGFARAAPPGPRYRLLLA